jgi:hypothetical protein
MPTGSLYVGLRMSVGVSNGLQENGQSAAADSIIWPIVQNDLAYVNQYWNSTTFGTSPGFEV